MRAMFRLQRIFSTQRTRAMRWLVAACVGLTLMGSALAQSTVPKPELPLQAQGSTLQVKQTLWMDDSRLLDFESARTQEFKPFNPFERLIIGDKVAWLRLHMERADDAAGPLLLHLTPSQLGDVTLYSPVSQAPLTWQKRKLEPQELVSKIRLGEAFQGDDFYLRIESRNNSGIIAFVGTADELKLHDAKLAVVMTFISTLTWVALLVFLWRTACQFSWMSVLISAALVSSQIQIWIGLGYAYTVLGLPLEAGIALATPNVIANFTIAGGVLVLIACALFPGQRWMHWLWTWSILHFCLFLYSFIEPSAASSLSMRIWLIGPLMLAACLTVAAIREPSSLRLLSSKVAFFSLLLTCVMLELVAFNSGGAMGSLPNELSTDLFIKNIFTRFPQLLMITVLSSWIFERIRANQLNTLSGELQKSKESLEMESKRLDRQRKFTAMLAHELKNPLTASQMALAGIQQRLARDDPAQDRAEKIKSSLQEINAILDRCAEVDGYEQGQMPMAVHTFAVQQLLDLVEAANPNERIYTLVRDLPPGAALTSDVHYIKLILNNLLSNALKYSPPDSLVELELVSRQTEKGTHLDIRVTNEVGAAGVPDPSRLFERFYRTEGARNQSGAGLGLWLSQALAGALGTSLVSQTEDNWISFTLTLTLDDAQR